MELIIPVFCSAKRKFNRESLVRLTAHQKQLILEARPSSEPVEEISPDTCMACHRKFKNSRGLSIHQKACKGERVEEAKIRGLEPMFCTWESKGAEVLSKEKKKWRDSIRIWVMRRIKMELNLGLASENPQNLSVSDDSKIHQRLVSAGKTIVPCLQGSHAKCAEGSFCCSNKDSSVTDYNVIPSAGPLASVPPQTIGWLASVVDMVLGPEALQSLVVNGRKATTSLVESVHREIRLPIAKGRMHRKNETALIKSGKEISSKI